MMNAFEITGVLAVLIVGFYGIGALLYSAIAFLRRQTISLRREIIAHYGLLEVMKEMRKNAKLMSITDDEHQEVDFSAKQVPANGDKNV